MGHGPARLLRRLWLWGRGVPVVSACGRWSSFDSRWGRRGRFRRCWRSHSFVRRSFVGGRRLLVVVLFACVYRVVGSLASFWEAGVVCGDVGGVTWHAGDMEGAPRVVDAGDVGVWLSGLLVGLLSCFVGDMGC